MEYVWSTLAPEYPGLEPYGRLEIPGTLYISSLALFEGFRGMGLGTEMLSIARDRAPVVPHPLINHTGDVILMSANV